MSLQDDLRRNETKLRYYLKRWRNYALAFHVEALQAKKYWYPTRQQYELCKLRDRHKNIAIAAGRGVGKSWWQASEIWRHLICFKVPGIPCKVLLTGPSCSQLEGVMMAEIAAAREHLLPWLADLFEQTKEMVYCRENPDNWFASPRTARKEAPGSVQGQHGVTLNVFDEGPGIDDKIFKVITTGTTHEDAYNIASGNPDKLSGYFYRIFNQFKGQRWTKYYIDCFDCLKGDSKSYPYFRPDGREETISVEGIVTKTFIEDQTDEYGIESPTFISHVRGKFPNEESDSLIKKKHVDNAWDVLRSGRIFSDHKRIIGIDPGHESDPTAYVIRWGQNIEEADSWTGMNPTATADRIIGRWEELYAQKRHPEIFCVDPIGIGDGVLSYLQKWARDKLLPLGIKVVLMGVKASEVAPSGGTVCRRMRDWLWWQARIFYQDQQPYFCERSKKMEELAEELLIPHYTMPQGRWVVVEDKDAIKKRGFRSPNLADAHNLTFKADWRSPLPQEKKKIDPYRLHRRKKVMEGKQEWKVA